jgi:hypothetical protein
MKKKRIILKDYFRIRMRKFISMSKILQKWNKSYMSKKKNGEMLIMIMFKNSLLLNLAKTLTKLSKMKCIRRLKETNLLVQ